MKLKQEDRELFREFFEINKQWIKSNSLNVEENLVLLKGTFLDYMNFKNQLGNLSVLLFKLTLDQEIIECKKRIFEMKYNGNSNPLYRKLNYIPVCPKPTDNEEILIWIKQSQIFYEVQKTDIMELEKSLQKKLKQNESERLSSWESTKNKIVK